jgi:hypothetical protein
MKLLKRSGMTMAYKNDFDEYTRLGEPEKAEK